MHDLSHVLFALVPPGPGGDAAGGLASLFPILLVFGIFYMLLIRPQNLQRKQHDEMLKELKKGDKIKFSGGIHGTITNVAADVLKVRVADGTSLQVDRSAVNNKLGEETDKT